MIVAVKCRIFKMVEPSNKTPQQPSKTPDDPNKTSDDSNKPTEQLSKTQDQSAPVEKVNSKATRTTTTAKKTRREPLMNLPPLEPEQPHDGSPTPPVAPKPEANEMSIILPHLYVGKLSDLKDEKQMEKNHITHVLSIYDVATPSDQGRQYLCISAKDNSLEKNTVALFECQRFYTRGPSEKSENLKVCKTPEFRFLSVLIQCNSGISLSTTLAIVYIMTVTDFSCNQTKSIVQSRRVTAQPNLAFTKKLEKFEKESLANEKQRFRLLNPKELEKYNDHGEYESVLASLQKNGNAASK